MRVSGKVKISPPIVCAALGLVPLCVVRPLREWYGVLSVDRSRNEFRRGVKSTKFAIAGAKRKTEILSKLQICPHTIRNYALEISYGYGSLSKYLSKLWHSPQLKAGFAAVAHARLRLSRLELIGGSGRTAGRYASGAARAFNISPTAFEHKQARRPRGGALGAGVGRVGFAGGGLF